MLRSVSDCTQCSIKYNTTVLHLYSATEKSLKPGPVGTPYVVRLGNISVLMNRSIKDEKKSHIMHIVVYIMNHSYRQRIRLFAVSIKGFKPIFPININVHIANYVQFHYDLTNSLILTKIYVSQLGHHCLRGSSLPVWCQNGIISNIDSLSIEPFETHFYDYFSSNYIHIFRENAFQNVICAISVFYVLIPFPCS